MTPRDVPAEGDLVPVGWVGRPHGLDGAFVVVRPSEDLSRFRVGETLLVDGEPATITISRGAGGRRVAIALDRVVERGQELAVPRSELPALEGGSYYHFQLVGLVVEEDGRRLGTVQQVLPGAANDNLELDTGVLVPLIEDAITAIDLEAGRVLVTPGFLG